MSRFVVQPPNTETVRRNRILIELSTGIQLDSTEQAFLFDDVQIVAAGAPHELPN